MLSLLFQVFNITDMALDDWKKLKQDKRFFQDYSKIINNKEVKGDSMLPAILDDQRLRRRSSIAPEYLIRTGSMKSKDIKDDISHKDREYLTLPGSHYASYLLQTGCFLWKGRHEHYTYIAKLSSSWLVK